MSPLVMTWPTSTFGVEGTDIRHKCSENLIKTPVGVLVLLTGELRHRKNKAAIPTVHRSPKGASKADRIALVMRSGSQ